RALALSRQHRKQGTHPPSPQLPGPPSTEPVAKPAIGERYHVCGPRNLSVYPRIRLSSSFAPLQPLRAGSGLPRPVGPAHVRMLELSPMSFPGWLLLTPLLALSVSAESSPLQKAREHLAANRLDDLVLDFEGQAVSPPDQGAAADLLAEASARSTKA